MSETIEQTLERNEWMARLTKGEIGLLDALLITLQLQVPAHPLLVARLQALENDYKSGACTDLAQALGIAVDRREAARQDRMTLQATVHGLVEHFMQKGHPTAANRDQDSCFEMAAEVLGMKPGTVKDHYYEHCKRIA